MTYTEKLVDLVIHFREQPIPSEVIDRAKIFIMDSIGCAIGGYATGAGKQIVMQAKEFKGADEAAVIGDGSLVSAPFACWANSSLANVLDMDDVFAGTAHQANCLVPTALGIGQAVKKSGLDVLRAVILGFEVGSRIMMYCWPSPSKARTYFPSTWQVFDAVTVTGTLLGLGPKELCHAYGLAGTVPPLPIDMQKFVERPMGFSKNVFGWTTLTGIFWTQMAKKGAQGTAQIFDGDAGFWTIMGSDFRDFDKLVEGLGEKYNILDTKYKPYPLCTWGHSSVDAFEKIVRENKLSVERIGAINVKTLKRAVDFLASPRMETMYDAQFSLPHALSMVALGKKPGPEWMTEENIFHNPVAKSIAEKVSMHVDPAAEQVFNDQKGLAIPTEVEVKTVDGKVYRENVTYSKGTPNNPFTEEELKDKFKTLASAVFEPNKINQIIDTVGAIDRLDDISTLMRLLRVA
jgi:2-methylcitrate dehydratase PrpD